MKPRGINGKIKRRRLLMLVAAVALTAFAAGCGTQKAWNLWANDAAGVQSDITGMLGGGKHIVKTALAGAGVSGADSSGQSGQSGEGQGEQPVQSETGLDGASQEGKGSAGVPGDPGMTQPAAVPLTKPTLPVVHYDAAPGSKLAALTFDDGPDAKYTPAILDILEKYKVKATFFTVGTQVKKYPNMMRHIVKEGHEIGNHTYHHANLTKLDNEKIADEIMWTDTLIKREVGFVPRLVRAPYGALSPSVKEIIKDNGRTLVNWTVDTRDWAGETAAEIRENVDEHIHPGGIILMHSFGSSNIHNTVDALPLVIQDLHKKGYTLVTVDELLSAKEQAQAVSKK
ncbi:polysaccharide deacetylase family protein [Paenibacillus sp. sptzw28]|uniref:polysaccharide deacetylase family protein n=1 Tax=Paenibacillus sp. sptzw28 TaxID=715179 RepID=UPI001C6DE174|nr:polysaccharide deacetylase family protein [Paenibacillus sp. sptzw28]QYR21154.1 polysaccharide deacetylase family protein [Paenibacillus sp. sptzw28]